MERWRWASGLLAVVLAGCGDDGAETPTDSASGRDGISDVAAAPDLAPQPDAAPDLASDTPPVAQDVSLAPDVGPITCPDVPAAGDPVNFTQVPRTFPPPTLIGNVGGAGDPLGAWKLQDLTFFQPGTFVDWVEVTFSNAGDTSGNAVLEAGGVFGVHLFLDLSLRVVVGENVGEDTASATIELGGPVNIAEGAFHGDFTRCGAGVAETGVVPDRLAFDHDGARLRLAVELSKEAIIGLLPPDQQENAAFVVTGPLTVVARFSR